MLYNFTPSSGTHSVAPLIFDKAGNLYGTAEFGGGGACSTIYGNGCGTVFELSPQSGGGWTETVLHAFQYGGQDGSNPMGGLNLDASGNLYGTTTHGGNGGCRSGTTNAPLGCGTVFELSPQSGGGWAETVLHNFENNGKDGNLPEGGLIFDSAGSLYGSTFTGGTYAGGTVFELSPQSGGRWTETILFTFSTVYPNGFSPSGNLVFDAVGNLYGATGGGGESECNYGYGCGTIFRLSPRLHGTWAQKVLHQFGSMVGDGYYPNGSLILDASGNLYGTTYSGDGSGYFGTVFEISPRSGGGYWPETILYSLQEAIGDGIEPLSGLLFDTAGNLYGTTAEGADHDRGTVFELSPQSGGVWSEKVVYGFEGGPQDGHLPEAGLVFDSAGNLYGTARDGGSHGDGIVFEVTP